MIAAFKNYKRYPIEKIHGKLVIKTEHGDFYIGEQETTCGQCGKQLGYLLEKEDKPHFCEIYNDKNFFVPYFWTLHGDCIYQLHGGFSRPVWKRENASRQSFIEEWCE